MVAKLNQDKNELVLELSKLKKEINTLMLVNAPRSTGLLMQEPAADLNNEQHTIQRQRLLEGEKLIADINATKKDTNLLGAKLQEMYLRNETLSAKLNERNSHLLEAKKMAEKQ